MSANGHDRDDEPPSGWEQHAEDLSHVADPAIRRALVAIIERDRQQWRQRAAYLAELRGMRRAQDDRDERLFTELAQLLSVSIATGARVARLDNEREITRQQVKDVHRWADEIRKETQEIRKEAATAAETSQQRVLVTAQQATEALAKAAEARIGEARASAQLEVEKDARRSLTTEIVVKQTEGRARAWSVKSALLGAVLLAATAGLGRVGQWVWERVIIGGGK